MIDKWIKTTLRDSGAFTGVQIHAVVMPQGFNYPAIIYNRIDSQIERSKEAIVNHVSIERWSFGVYAKTLDKVRSLEDSVKNTFEGATDESESIQLMYIADTSSDFYEEEFEVYSVNVDFYIRKLN